MRAILFRWSFLAALCQFVGTLLISYGFRLRVVKGAFVGDIAGLYSQVALQAQLLWLVYLGWTAVVIGFGLQVLAEVQAARQAKMA